jgi:hypothetical protein
MVRAYFFRCFWLYAPYKWHSRQWHLSKEPPPLIFSIFQTFSGSLRLRLRLNLYFLRQFFKPFQTLCGCEFGSFLVLSSRVLPRKRKKFPRCYPLFYMRLYHYRSKHPHPFPLVFVVGFALVVIRLANALKFFRGATAKIVKR